MTYCDYITKLKKVMDSCIITDTNGAMLWEEGFDRLVKLFVTVKKNGNKVFFIGNGGSAGIAEHMTADYLKNGGMLAVNLFGSAALTCIGNDLGYENVFAHSLKILGAQNDLLVAVSSSGNSPNIVQAVNIAKSKHMHIITFSGFESNNKIRLIGDVNLYVPIRHYGMVESIHTIFLQQIVDIITDKCSWEE